MASGRMSFAEDAVGVATVDSSSLHGLEATARLVKSTVDDLRR
jgi:hypothetical protein